MFDRRALPGMLAGFVALVLAAAAIVTQEAVLVVVAGVLTMVCVVLVLTVPSRAPVRYKERRNLQEEAEKLAKENDRMAARAAKFEAEAIAAREKLTTAMLADRDDAPTLADNVSIEQAKPEITDPETGIFTQVFFDASLGKRVSAARRGLRPLTVAFVEVVTEVGQPGERHAPAEPIADILVQTLREADTVARMDDGSFAVLLEDTPENGAIWTLERIRRRISEDLDSHTVRAGVSCYPAHAFDAEQLTAQSEQALQAAREWRQDRIEVTTASPDD